MRHFKVLIMMICSFFLISLMIGCKTTGTSSDKLVVDLSSDVPANWDGYNASNRLRIDILVVKHDDKVVELVEDARADWDFDKFAQLSLNALYLVQNEKIERADGTHQVLVEFTNLAMPFGKFFSYHYGDTNNPNHPTEVIPVSSNSARFEITAEHGYASIDLPYGYINEATFVEVSVPGTRTLFPYDGDTVMNEPGELYELARSNKQFYLMLIVLASGD